MLTIFGLTLKEALRRRAPIVSVLVALLLLVGAFIPLQGKLLELPRDEANRIYSSLYIFFATNITKFFAAILGISLASGAISAELERGVLSAILPKPIRRFEVYAGKWLGLVAFIALNVVLWDTVIFLVARYRAPLETHLGVWTAFPYLLCYPMVFVTLALFFSTFASFPLSSGLTVLLTGIGWAEGMLYLLHQLFNVGSLLTLSKTAGLIMPIGRMSRSVSDGMGELPGFVGVENGPRAIMSGSLFKEIVNGPLDFPYVLLYIVVFFFTGAVVFGRRDI